MPFFEFTYRRLVALDLLKEEDESELIEGEHSVLLNVMHFQNLSKFTLLKGFACLCESLSKVSRSDVAAVISVKVLKKGEELVLSEVSWHLNGCSEKLRVVDLPVSSVINVTHYLGDFICS